MSNAGEGSDEESKIRTDVYTVEVMSAHGETWIWSDVALDDAMEVYEMLGEPSTFYRLGNERTE